MTNHEHKECEHPKLKFCKKCNVVECEDCKMEWAALFRCPSLRQIIPNGTGTGESPRSHYKVMSYNS